MSSADTAPAFHVKKYDCMLQVAQMSVRISLKNPKSYIGLKTTLADRTSYEELKTILAGQIKGESVDTIYINRRFRMNSDHHIIHGMLVAHDKQIPIETICFTFKRDLM